MAFFQGYRHGFSCNNLKDIKGTKLTSLFRKDPEPSLTMWGILQCLDKSMEVNGVDPESQIVFVSPLLRTWLTATLLFLPHTKELVLRIAPHLKEHHQFSGDTGNLPASSDLQLKKYTEFLNYIVRVNTQFDDPKDHSMISNLKNMMQEGKKIEIKDFFHKENILFEYKNGKWNNDTTPLTEYNVVKPDNVPESHQESDEEPKPNIPYSDSKSVYNEKLVGTNMFDGGRNSYVGKIEKQNVWSIKFNAFLNTQPTADKKQPPFIIYNQIQFEAGKYKPNEESAPKLRSSCENLCEFTGPSISFGKTCDNFMITNIYNTYTHQKNIRYPTPEPLGLLTIDQNRNLMPHNLTDNDYYSTDITKFVEWILKHDNYKSTKKVFFVSHSQALQDLADLLSEKRKKEINSTHKHKKLVSDANKTDMVLKKVTTTDYPDGMLTNDKLNDPSLNKKNATPYIDPEAEDEDDFSKLLPLDKYGRPYIKDKSWGLFNFTKRAASGGRKKNHRKTNKKHRSRKSRR